MTAGALKAGFSELEKNLLAETEKYYGDWLVSLVLFGSAARGTQRFDSDVDFLIVAKDLPRGRMSRVREYMAVERVLEPLMRALRADGINTYLSPVLKTPEEAEAGSPLFLDMVEDAKILLDRGGFFARRLDRLKERLGALGAKRIWRGNAWYWDLKSLLTLIKMKESAGREQDKIDAEHLRTRLADYAGK